jgi:conjugative relaxase-like TrwC/TraI family protein
LLKIHVLHRGGHAYYVDDLVPGRAEGTLLAGEAPGWWAGRGASDLGLSGTVAGPDLAELLAGRHPTSGRTLRQERPKGTAGFDLTFCAPKSVSILHLLGPSELAGEVGASHRAAVADATGYLERAAAGVRRQRGGAPLRLAATGLATGAFLHRTSRALDPHLHTHVVVANVAQGVDGSWSSLDSRRLFHHGPAAQAVYHARLRDELTERLGVAWQMRPSGMADVVGVDPILCRLFSGRTGDMEEHLHRQAPSRPAGRPASRRIAALVTRLPKDRTRTVDSLREDWRSRASDIGFAPSELTRAVGLGRSVAERAGRDHSPDTAAGGRWLDAGRGLDCDRLARRLHELAGVDRALSRRDLIAEVAAACPTGARSALVESVAGRLVDGVPVVAPPADVHEHAGPGHEPRWRPGNLVDRLADLPGSALTTQARLDRSGRGGEEARSGLGHRFGRTIERPDDLPEDRRQLSDLPADTAVVLGERWRSEVGSRLARAREPGAPDLGR